MSLLLPCPPLKLISHGLKRMGVKDNPDLAIVPRCDLMIDCRGIQEHGLDRNVFAKYKLQIVEHSPVSVQAMVDLVTDGLRHVKDRRFKEPDAMTRPFVVCFVCAYVMNRSFTTKYVVGERLTKLGYEVRIPKEKL